MKNNLESKNNLEDRKLSNTVKFSQKNEIRLIENQERVKRKVSANPARQSRNILNKINKKPSVMTVKTAESESEGYHSDCSSPAVQTKENRKSSLEKRKRYSNSRKLSSKPGNKSNSKVLKGQNIGSNVKGPNSAQGSSNNSSQNVDSSGKIIRYPSIQLLLYSSFKNLNYYIKKNFTTNQHVNSN